MELFRGSSDIPLTQQGLEKAHKLGMDLAQKGGLDRISASSLGRTRTTAGIISHYTRAPIVHVGDELHPWHLGGLEGSEVTPEKLDYMQHLIQFSPDEKIPGIGPESTALGESFNEFKGRVLPFYDKLLRGLVANPNSREGVVTHSRNLKLMKAWLRKGAGQDFDIDTGEMTQDSDKPGSVLRVSYEPRMGFQSHNVDLHSPTPLQGGVYLIRHENTAWNRSDSEGANPEGQAS